jgi:hypothetical protein
VGFCLWLWKRARGGDEIELMVHEPYLAFWEGTWRQTAVAAVHRLMTVILLRSARRVWFSIPAWEPMWKPYALGRSVPFAWLPIPSSVGPADPARVAAIRSKLGAGSNCVAGTFGTYGSLIRPLLFGVLPEILRQADAPRMKLIGAGRLEFLDAFVERYPDHRSAVSATGLVSDADLAAHLSACDLLIEPYPDGISSRRTSAMAALTLGIPLVTTRGRLSEPFWSDSGSVRLSDTGDDRALAAQAMDLVRHPEERKRLGEAGCALYRRLFDISRTVNAIRAAGAGRAE